MAQVYDSSNSSSVMVHIIASDGRSEWKTWYVDEETARVVCESLGDDPNVHIPFPDLDPD